MSLVSKAFSDIVTFSRSSNATRIGPTGRVEYAPHNLLQRSQEFDNAYWSSVDLTVTANAAIAPDGTVTADRYVPASVSNAVTRTLMSAAVTVANATHSVFVKSDGYSKVALREEQSTGAFAAFDLISGTVLASSDTISQTITSVGNGWYRIAMTVTTPTQGLGIRVLSPSYTNGSVLDSWTPDGTSGILIWGAQLSVGPYALDYTPTTSAAVYGPRFDYDPVTLAAKGLLIEEQRTNLLTYSEQFDNGYWIKGSSSVTANMVASPDGTVNADGLISSASGSGASGVFVIVSGLSSGSTYTMSCYIKSKGANWAQLIASGTGGSQSVTRGWFNISTGAVGTINNTSSAGTIQNIGNGWYRCSMIVPALTTTAPTIYFACANGDGIDAFTNDGVSGLYIWGAQLEDNSFATSYIPTGSSTVTRSADVASVNTLSPWWNGTEGTFLFDFNQVGTTSIAAIGDDTFNNSLRFNVVNMARGTGTGFANLVTLGTSQNGSHKLAVAMKVNDYAGSFDGGAVSTQTTASMVPASNVLGIGRDYGTNGYMNGWMRRLAFYPRRLTNAELQALTA